MTGADETTKAAQSGPPGMVRLPSNAGISARSAPETGFGFTETR